MFTRWCVTFEEIDTYGNQGIGADVVSAKDITDALRIMTEDLESVFEHNKDQIASWRIVGIQMMPEFGQACEGIEGSALQ